MPRPRAGPRKGALGAQHTLFQGPVLMRHTIDAYATRGFANITGVGWFYQQGWLGMQACLASGAALGQ